jgi:S1-C subfamily serine protease
MSSHLRCRGVVVFFILITNLINPSAAIYAASAVPDAVGGGAATVPSTPADASTNSVENSVVKIFSTVGYPDLYKPWAKQTPTEISGSGVVIEGKRILSNAHLVLYASDVQVQASQSGDKVSATVVAIAPSIDLAILKLDDETFFDSHPPLPRSKNLPDIRDTVMVYGYPQGGRTLSITKGIISRIEFSAYNYGAYGLRIQIDAAINPGNSGGPAVVGDKMVGLAFSHLSGGDNIGYLIPTEEIEMFLQDIADGHYHGKPYLFDDCQTLENPALRSFLKLDKTVHGMIVHKPESNEAAYPLKEWDIITKIGETPVDDQGMIKLDSGTPVFFKYLVPKLVKHDKVPLTVWRGGKEIQVEAPTARNRAQVLPSLEGGYPSYFVWGPLVFSGASLDFVTGLTRLSTGGSAMAVLGISGSPLMRRLGDKPAFEGEQLVVISSPFFPHRLAKGYSNPAWEVVKTVNGQRVKNLGHLVQLLRDSEERFIIVEFDNSRGETLVFSRAEMQAATEEILTNNGLRSQGSPDAMAIWNAKPAH